MAAKDKTYIILWVQAKVESERVQESTTTTKAPAQVHKTKMTINNATS